MLEEMRKEQEKFNKEVLETLQLMRQEIKDNQEKMEKIKEEQKKVMSEVEAIRNEMKTLKRDSDKNSMETNALERIETTSDHFSSQKIEFAISFEGRNGTFSFLPTDTILDLKNECAIRFGVPVHQQRIYFTDLDGFILEFQDHRTLHGFDIRSYSVVSMHQRSY
uniref:Ubiquitin-like domain-containing protein n=1 Tax=Caenorhabditis tropicalis TaxID=1561998 RepID=A0A1I7U581_9PELO